MSLTKCQEEKQMSEDLLNMDHPPVGVFVPKCRLDGTYADEQCHASVGHCWCVDDKGVELEGTRVRGSAKCGIPGDWQNDI